MDNDKKSPIPDSAKNGGISARGVIAMILGLLVLIFVIQNWSSAKMHLFFWDIEIPLGLLILIIFALGVLTSGMTRKGIRRLRGVKRDTRD